MDLSYYIESAWRLSPPLEHVPDAAAWIFCVALALWLIHFVVFWRPRSCMLGLGAWLTWLAWQATWVNGFRALELAYDRGIRAKEATDLFSQQLLALAKAWIHFFLPFLSDMWWSAVVLYKKMSVRHRLLVCGFLLVGYAIMEALRLFQRHSRLVMHLFFHASFLVGGPLLWYGCGHMPPEWLPWCLTHAITTVPTALSLLTLSCASQTSISSPSEPRSPSRTSRSRVPAFPTTNIELHRLWLSYWACWPALAVFEAGVSVVVPRLTLPSAGDTWLQGFRGRMMQAELQRGLLTFCVWLQFWQGSRLLQYTMQSLLFKTSILEYILGFFGTRGLQALSIFRGGLTSSGISPMGGLRIVRWISSLTKRLWVVCIALAGLAVVVLALIRLFYRAVSVVSGVATLMLWLCAASDSADTLARYAEDMYSKKLSFWVLAMLWEALTALPLAGVLLRLFTPFAFSVWLLAGEMVMRRLVLPVTCLGTRTTYAIVSIPLSALRAIGFSSDSGSTSVGAVEDVEDDEGAEDGDDGDDDSSDAADDSVGISQGSSDSADILQGASAKVGATGELETTEDVDEDNVDADTGGDAADTGGDGADTGGTCPRDTPMPEGTTTGSAASAVHRRKKGRD